MASAPIPEEIPAEDPIPDRSDLLAIEKPSHEEVARLGRLFLASVQPHP